MRGTKHVELTDWECNLTVIALQMMYKSLYEDDELTTDMARTIDNILKKLGESIWTEDEWKTLEDKFDYEGRRLAA